jgi:hypothetical protein
MKNSAKSFALAVVGAGIIGGMAFVGVGTASALPASESTAIPVPAPVPVIATTGVSAPLAKAMATPDGGGNMGAPGE